MRKISEGTSEFQSEIEEVNIFVKELKKYNEKITRGGVKNKLTNNHSRIHWVFL